MDAHPLQGRLALGIDFGTSHTVAVVRRPDGRLSPLLFDGSPLMPSAVYADTDGQLVVGRDALHSGRRSPERLEPNPKRTIDSDTVLLGDQELPVTDVIAAVLRRVGEECARVAGVPSQTTVTVPASWGPTRRQVIADAAEAAGMGPVQLVAEPVAAATYFAESLGHGVLVGSSVVVYDFGAGTFDASVVARRPTGFEVLAVDGRDDLGGLDLDLALVDHIGRQFADQDAWRRLTGPTEPAERRHRRTLLDEVRIAKERLSRYQSADITVPLLDVDTHLTREELEQATGPLVTQAVRVTQGVIRASGLTVDQTAGVFLVGGASRMPLVATLLHRELGVAPTAIEQPELVVAEGSLLAATGGGSLPPTASPGMPAPSPAAPSPTPSPLTPPAAVPTPPPVDPTQPATTAAGATGPLPATPPAGTNGAPGQGRWTPTRKLVTGITAGFAALVLLAVILALVNGDPEDPDIEPQAGDQVDDSSTEPTDIDTGAPEDATTDAPDGLGHVDLEDIADARFGDQIGPPLANHTHEINNIAFADVGGRPAVLTASGDHTVGIWDLETGDDLGQFKEHGDVVLDVKIMEFEDGALAVSRDGEDVVRVWDPETLEEIRSIDTEDGPRALRFAEHGGGPIAVGTMSFTFGYWDLETGDLVVEHDMLSSGEIISEADVITIDGRAKLVSSGSDSLLRLYDVHSGEQEGNAFAAHADYIRGIGTGFVDGTPVAVTNSGDELRVWDLTTFEQLGSDLTDVSRQRFRGDLFEYDGSQVLLGSGTDNTIRMWDIESGEQVENDFNGHENDAVTVLLTELDGTTIAVSGGADGTVRRWSLGA